MEIVAPLSFYEQLSVIKFVIKFAYQCNQCFSFQILSGLEDAEELLALQMYLSGSLSVRTSIMDFHMFKRQVDIESLHCFFHLYSVNIFICIFEFQVGHSYYHIKRPLFVLLNDLNETKDQFIKVSV